MFGVTGASRIAQREGSWDSSPVELVTPLMIAGVVTPTGTKTGSASQTVALASAETPSVAVMGGSMLSQTLEMMTQLTPSLALCATP